MNKISRCEIKELTVPNGNNVCDQKNAERNVRNTRRRISGRQRNHGDFYLPAIISHLEEPSFYIAVALWGKLTGRPFSREDVAQAFRVTARRAADVMTYLATGVSHSVVGLEKKVVRMGSGRAVLLMTILSVDEQAQGAAGEAERRSPAGPAVSAGSAPRPRPRGAAAEGLQAARDLFLRGRRPPPTGA